MLLLYHSAFKAETTHFAYFRKKWVDSEMDTFTHLGVLSLPFCLWREEMEEAG